MTTHPLTGFSGILLTLLVPLAAATSGVACHGGATDGRPAAARVSEAAPVPADSLLTAERIARGEQLFRNKAICYACHGMDAAGTTLAPDLTDGDWLHGSGEFDEIVRIIRSGIPEPKQYPTPMPPMGGAQLTEREIRDLAAYNYALSHAGRSDLPDN